MTRRNAVPWTKCATAGMAVLVAFASAGCVILSQRDAQDLTIRIKETHAYSKRIDKNVANVNDKMLQVVDDGARTRANTNAVIDQLRTEMQRTQSVIEENTFQMGELKRKLDELRANLYPKLGIVEKGASTRRAPPPLPRPALPPAAPMPVSPLPIAPAPAAPTPTPAVNPEEDYRRAYTDYNKALASGNYELAKMGFMQYLELYPYTDDADNAQFWLAQCYFKNGEDAEALEEFKKLYRNHPRSDKTPNAMFTEAQVEMRLGRPARARAAFKQIIVDYPTSDPAAWAKTKLDEMGAATGL